MRKKRVEEFDYSGLAEELRKLSKPAQRALIMNGIKTPAQLARRSLDEVLGLHGMGPGSIPILKAALKKRGLAFSDS